MLDMGLQKIGKKNKNNEAMISNLQILLLWSLFMDGVHRATEALYFLPLSSQKFPVLI